MKQPDDDENSLPEWRVAVRKLQNPYASLYYAPEPLDFSANVQAQYRASENPYAFHHYLESAVDEPPAQPTPAPAASITIRTRLSKADFEAGCRSVFRRYMPEMERGKLRAHHQDFIRRNVACSPERRHALLQALQRYDLSSEPSLRTYFNREEDVFTEAKLRKIEESVKDE